jgi:glyoxylase-like metal-dependent hydrolase (beta-lactamase superfamily II)
MSASTTRRALFGLLSAATFSLALHAQPAQAGTLHVFTSDAAGFNTHSVWYDDGREVTVVDAQFTHAHAQAVIDHVKSRTRSPITRVIVTHPNPDKFNGLPVFHAAGAVSIASAATAAALPGVDAYKRRFWIDVARAFTEATYPRVEPVKQTFTKQMTIRLASGETLTLIGLPQPGISSHQTVVRIDRTGDLVVGDLVHSNHHAWLEGGIVGGQPVPTLAGWKAGLGELPKLGHGKVYGGRGDALPVRDAVAQQVAYLERAEAIVDRYLDGLGDRLQEVADPARRQAHHAAIQAAVAAAFPGFAGPDMVGYSVYGLVRQKLQQRRP